MKFTFKNQPRPTGLAAIGAKKHIDIKLKGKYVGSIAEESYAAWRVGFMILKTEAQLAAYPNCAWNWIFIKKRFATEEAARAAVNSDSMKVFLLAYTLSPLED